MRLVAFRKRLQLYNKIYRYVIVKEELYIYAKI